MRNNETFSSLWPWHWWRAWRHKWILTSHWWFCNKPGFNAKQFILNIICNFIYQCMLVWKGCIFKCHQRKIVFWMTRLHYIGPGNELRVCRCTSVICNSEMFGSEIVRSHSSINRCTLVMTVSSWNNACILGLGEVKVES